jgi:TPR repeat protein
MNYCTLARVIHSSNKYGIMRMGFFRILPYFLCIFALNQALYANEGSNWLGSSVSDVQNAAEAKNSYAQGFLALVYAHGDKGVDVSFENAKRWALLSAQADHWLGHFALGYLARFPSDGLANARNVGRHYLKAFQDPDGKMIKAAATGDPIAAYALAEIFTSDEVRPSLVPDLDLAARHYSVSSNAGYGPAMVEFSLLKTHAVGDVGFSKDLAGGISLLEEASRSNLPSAHHYLGRAYFKGLGVKSDLKMALVHFQAAADRGYAISQLTVADFYAYGVVGPPKVDLALRYARLAMGQQEKKALEKIAEYEALLAGNQSGSGSSVTAALPRVPSPIETTPPPPTPPSPGRTLPGAPVEPSLAPDLPSSYAPSVPPPPTVAPLAPPVPIPPVRVPPAPSLSAGSSVETRELAKKHYFGRGSPPDYGQSLVLFTQSANAGDAESARYLGIMYLRGKGIPKDNAKALEWFTLASDRGDALAGKNVQMLKSILGN